MNIETRHVILLVIAGIGLVKALCGVIGPAAFKRFVRWWCGAGSAFHKVCGAICIAIAGLLLAVVLMQHELVDWVLMLFAVLLVWGASLYFRENDLRKLADSIFLKRGDNFLRILSLCSAAVCGVLLWIAVTGMLGR